MTSFVSMYQTSSLSREFAMLKRDLIATKKKFFS